MVSSADDTSIRAAAYALKHPLVTARGSHSSPRTRKPLPKILEPHPKPLKRSLTRQMTLPIESLGKKFFSLPYLRGLSAFLIISITQWYFSTIGDFFLSGHPKELKSGYGSTSIILAVFFGGSFALWTHHAITRPRGSGNILESLPQRQDIIVELYSITTVWALCEQVVRSLPLALSRNRIFAIRQYAWTPKLWNTLDAKGQRILLFKFAVLYLFYLVLVAGFSIPASMTLRRIHASMLPQADEAIVPFAHGNPKPREDDEDSETHSPGLSISEAWATLNWSAYIRVVRVFVIYWMVNQALHFLCWEADWLLHDLFGTDRYDSPFPSGPTRLTLRFLEWSCTLFPDGKIIMEKHGERGVFRQSSFEKKRWNTHSDSCSLTDLWRRFLFIH